MTAPQIPDSVQHELKLSFSDESKKQHPKQQQHKRPPARPNTPPTQLMAQSVTAPLSAGAQSAPTFPRQRASRLDTA